MNSQIRVQKGESGEIKVSFSYNPTFGEKIKTIKGHKWHPEEKYWSFLNTTGILEKILKIFENEEIHIDPGLKVNLSNHVIAIPSSSREKQSHNFPIPPLAKGGKEGFEDLRYIQELLGHKSSKTTEIYTHVSNRSLSRIESPLDTLNLKEGSK